MINLKLITVLLLVFSLSRAALADQESNRHNVFEPIFEDYNTVSAGFSSPKPTQATTRLLVTSTTRATQKPEPREPVLARFRSIPSSRALKREDSSDTTAVVPLYLDYLPSDKLSNVKLDDQPRHWSALENYYNHLRLGVQQQNQRSQQPYNVQRDSYEIHNQQHVDPSFDYKVPSLTLNTVAKVPVNQPPVSNFLIPLIEQSSSKSPPKDPRSDIKVLTTLIPKNSTSSTNIFGSAATKFQPYQNWNHSLVPIAINDSSFPVEQRPIILVYPSEELQISSHSPSKAQNLPVTISSDQFKPEVRILNDGRQLWFDMPEQVRVQWAQTREKHQQEVLGSAFDRQRSKEQQLEEAYCGRRNSMLNPHIHPSTLVQSKQIHYNPVGGKQSQQVIENLLPRFGEYPSHMGIYNGSKPEVDNYLCAATLVHEEFALTIASCFKGISSSANLIIRAGEWNMDKEASVKRRLEIREIAQIHYFRNDSLEHNLALVKFNKPIDDWWEKPYLSPACQIHSRHTLRTDLCWTPARNISLNEYFDPHGEGETKEKKTVSMIEEPIKLAASDEAECQRSTRIEFFNFQHPNYICSLDSARHKIHLNSTEHFGAGIYCYEGGYLSLVSMLHPIQSNSSSAFGYIDLSYYKPWMRNVIFGRY